MPNQLPKPLHFGTPQGPVILSMLKEHLAKGMDVNAKDEGGGTALSLATLAGHTRSGESSSLGRMLM